MATAPVLPQQDDQETRISKIRDAIANLDNLPEQLRQQQIQNLEREISGFRFSNLKDFLNLRNELISHSPNTVEQTPEQEVQEPAQEGGSPEEVSNTNRPAGTNKRPNAPTSSTDENGEKAPQKKILMTDRRLQAKAAEQAAFINSPQQIKTRVLEQRRRNEQTRQAQVEQSNAQSQQKLEQTRNLSDTISTQKSSAQKIVADSQIQIDSINQTLSQTPIANRRKRRELLQARAQYIKTKFDSQNEIAALNQQLTDAQSVQKQTQTDIEYAETLKELTKRETNLAKTPVELRQIRDDKYALELLTKEYGDPSKVKALKPEQLRSELQRIRRQYVNDVLQEAQIANEAKQKLDELETQGISPSISRRRPDMVLDPRTSLVQRSIGELTDDKTWSQIIDRREINQILNTDNPLKMLGFKDSDNPTPEMIDAEFSRRLSRLFVDSSDPKAQAAFDALQNTVGQFVNNIYTDQVSPEKLKNQADSQAKETRENRAASRQEISKYARNSYASGSQVPNPAKGIRNWIKERSKEDKELRRAPAKAVIGGGLSLLDRTISKGSAGIGKGIDRASGQRISRLAQNVAKSKFWDREIVKWDRYNPEDGGIQELQKIRITMREKYNEEKTKGPSIKNVFLPIKYIYDWVVGNRIAWVREFVSNTKDFVRDVNWVKKTISGVNKVKSTYKAATTKINTAIWDGRIGKTIIAVKRLGNAIEAFQRATFSGVQAGLITGGVALAAGAGGPATLALMGTAAGASFGVKVVADTLNSTRTHFWEPIAKFQQKYGVVKYGNVAPYGVKGGLIGPEAPRVNISRLRTLSNGFNWAFYGAAAGTVLATVGIISMPVGIVGGAALAMGGRYAGGRAMNKAGAYLFEKYGYNINRYSGFRMPIFSVVDTSLMPVWLKSQYNEIQRMGLGDYIYSRYLNSGQLNWGILKSGFNWLNLGFKGVSTYTTGSWLASLGGASSTGILTSALTGVIAGGLVGTGAAVLLGASLGTGALVGATAGAIIGGAIGAGLGSVIPFAGTWAGSFVGSTVGSFLGTWAGDWFDQNARKAYQDMVNKVKAMEALAKALENLLGSLSLLKGLLDFLNDLDKKFDPTMALGLTLTIIFSVTILTDMGMDTSSNKTDASSPGSTTNAAAQHTGSVAGASDSKIEPKTIDCLQQTDFKLTNPSTTLVTKIKAKSGIYEIWTEKFIFTNINSPRNGIEVNATLRAGELVGTCK